MAGGIVKKYGEVRDVDRRLRSPGGFGLLRIFLFFFFSSRRRHTRWPRDWSSDVCSSDLAGRPVQQLDSLIAVAIGLAHLVEGQVGRRLDVVAMEVDADLPQARRRLRARAREGPFVSGFSKIGRASCRERGAGAGRAGRGG